MKTELSKLFQKSFQFKKLEKIERAVLNMTLTEKLVFLILASILMSSTLFMLWQVNKEFLVEVPHHGGELSEGIIGTPRFINPLLAYTDADRDISALVYSGLLKATPQGNLVPDLAEKYTVSKDGLKYTFTIRKDATFHDGYSVTADDVIFTLQKAIDPLLKSPKRPNWEGVTVAKKGTREVEFIIKNPYSPFLENTTLGILPKHIWGNIESDQFPFSQYNVEPTGSGPYIIKKLKRDARGLPVYYQLESFDEYTLGRPYIKDLYIKVYTNEENLLKAYSDGEIESLSNISPKEAVALKKNGARIEVSNLPRIFGIFFNQNKASVLSNKAVRLALDKGLNKENIVSKVLLGYGVAIDSPIHPGPISARNKTSTSSKNGVEEAKKILENDGWKMNPVTKIFEKKTKKSTEILKFSVSTANITELKLAALMVKEQWNEIGVDVEILVFEQGDLNQNIIAPRDYDALLFGEIVGRDMDFYPFWHSAGRNYPGLNIALYTNSKVDKLLEEVRGVLSKEDRIKKYLEFEKEIKKDLPAIFIYSPKFIYIIPDDISNIQLGQPTISAERFLNIHNWHIETEKIWKIFIPKKTRI